MNLVELLFLILLMILAAVLGNYVARYIGWWAWIPAYGLGSLLMFIAIANLVKEVRVSVSIVRRKLRK